MRLFSIIENLSDEYGGPAVSLPCLLNSLRNEKSIDSVIYSISLSDSEVNSKIQEYELSWKVAPLSGWKKLMFSNSLKKSVNNDVRDGDVIFLNNLWNYPAILAYQVAKAKGAPLIVSVRGSLFDWSLQQGKIRKKIAWILFQRRILQDARVIHVTSEDEYLAVRKLGISTPVALIPHGIDFLNHTSEIDCEIAKANLSLSTSKRYFLFMSRLHKKKGLDALLKVWSKINHLHPEWELLIAGPDYGNFVDNISEVEQTKYLGMLKGSDKANVLSASSFFVLPTHSENFGVVIGEALSAGLPVITTRNAPWGEIESFDCGHLTTLCESDLEKSLRSYLELDKSTLVAKGRRGRDLIRKSYSWEKQAHKFSAVLKLIDQDLTSLDFVR